MDAPTVGEDGELESGVSEHECGEISMAASGKEMIERSGLIYFYSGAAMLVGGVISWFAWRLFDVPVNFAWAGGTAVAEGAAFLIQALRMDDQLNPDVKPKA